MLSFEFLEKVLGLDQNKYFSCDTLLTGQISLPDSFYFLGCWGNMCIAITRCLAVKSKTS